MADGGSVIASCHSALGPAGFALDFGIAPVAGPIEFNPSYLQAAPLGPAVTLHGRLAWVAYPIFRMYGAVGQPLYRHVIRSLLARLLPDPVLTTTLPTAGRASLTRQPQRHILHLLCGFPQIRGKALPTVGGSRVMEMIEDIPTLGPVSATGRLADAPSRTYDAMTGDAVPVTDNCDGSYTVTLPGLHIHRAVVFDD